MAVQQIWVSRVISKGQLVKAFHVAVKTPLVAIVFIERELFEKVNAKLGYLPLMATSW